MFTNHDQPPYRYRHEKKFFLIPVIILLFFGLTAAVQYLWNAILPGAVHVSAITYWQAAGLLVLCKILFGSFHFGKRHDRSGFGGPSRAMREKWTNMTDEERAMFKQRFKDRCRSMRR